MSLKLSGVVLSCESEVINYTSKKTGKEEKLLKGTIILQGDYGVLICSAYNPKTDLTAVKQGSKLSVEIGEYKNDRGIQSAVLRM